jgi:hypothetical protein
MVHFATVKLKLVFALPTAAVTVKVPATLLAVNVGAVA